MTGHQGRALPDPITDPTIKPERVAAILGVSRTAVYDGASRGEIPSLRVGRSVRIPTRLFLAKFFPDALDGPTEFDALIKRPPLTSGNGAASHDISRDRVGGSRPSEAA